MGLCDQLGSQVAHKILRKKEQNLILNLLDVNQQALIQLSEDLNKLRVEFECYRKRTIENFKVRR